MQPYVFPYLGYFQLIHAADKFVIYDDVNFIKQGWVNRNYILLKGSPHLFTVPVQKISSNALINQTLVSGLPHNWDIKLLQTISRAYKKAPYFNEVFPIIESVFTMTTVKSIGTVATESIQSVLKYLSLKTDIVATSALYNNHHLINAGRVIDICIKENADSYINPAGGFDLYNKETFLAKGIRLGFIKPRAVVYPQFQHEFIPGLSIIDTLMFNSVDDTVKMLNEYDLA